MYLLCKSFVPSLAMDDKKTGWVDKKLIVHLTISVTKWVWTSSLILVWLARHKCRLFRYQRKFLLNFNQGNRKLKDFYILNNIFWENYLSLWPVFWRLANDVTKCLWGQQIHLPSLNWTPDCDKRFIRRYMRSCSSHSLW